MYCINLERRPDRKAKMRMEFEKAGLDVEFFKATDGGYEGHISSSEYGCADSHIRIWKEIHQKGLEWALVFEDDAQLVSDFKKKLENVLERAPENWDYINLGPCHNYLMPTIVDSYSDLVKGRSWTTHCYLISKRGAEQLSKWNAKNLLVGIDSQLFDSTLNMYYTVEKLAVQDYSNNWFSCLMNSDIGLFRSFNLNVLKYNDVPYIVICLVCFFILIV